MARKTNLNATDLDELARAKGLLEHPGLTARITNLLGSPIEKGFDLLPVKWNEKVQLATRAALDKALGLALGTMKVREQDEPSMVWHKVAVALSGAGGGAFGLPALVLELPVSTTIMLRSIADIARSQGEDLESVASKLACLEVFALGGKSTSDDATESGYFLIRVALARAVADAAEHVAKRGIAVEAAPALIRLVSIIAGRFGIVVSQKAAAMAVPAIGAVGGAMVNTLFMDHFQRMADGHFTVRRLERKYGADAVREAYDQLGIQAGKD